MSKETQFEVSIISRGGTKKVMNKGPIIIEITNTTRKRKESYIVQDKCSLKKIKDSQIRGMIEMIKSSRDEQHFEPLMKK